MISPSEHVYDDDPNRGHPDVRTRLKGSGYYFLGNSFIQAAVQWAPAGEGTPLGLLVMDPDRLRKKREALTMDADRGLERTMVGVEVGGAWHEPTARATRVRWTTRDGVPAVEAVWSWAGGETTETFFCPDLDTPRLAREVRVRCDAKDGAVRIRAGAGSRMILADADAGGRPTSLVYRFLSGAGRVELSAESVSVTAAAQERWANAARLAFSDPLPERLGRASQFQLAAATSAAGRMDSSIWQYNREWVRDQAFVAVGHLMAGSRDVAALILGRLLREFITPEGGAMDSSEVRGPDEAELDQNGVLLYALEQYVRWTGDASMIAEQWPRVSAVAEYPLRPEFAHPECGLLVNSREFWERHRVHGITPGMELAHQVFVPIGLRAAARLAVTMRQPEQAARWASHAERLRAATLSHPRYGFVRDGALVKRLNVDGTVQERIDPVSQSAIPPGAPLIRPGAHWLNPDTCVTLPVAFRFLAPASDLARQTLDSVEPLWNQEWQTGGYGRYHVSSEPDSPGGWPFASIFVARAAVEAGLPERAWRVLRWLDTAIGAEAGSWLEFCGPRSSPPCPQVGIVPWTWSEMLALLVEHVLGVRPRAEGLYVAPRLLPGLEHASARLRIGVGALTLRVRREATGGPSARARIGGKLVAERAAGEIDLPGTSHLGDDIDIDIVLPRE